MPACNAQCGEEIDVDCGPCKHRDRGYPWPGGTSSRMSIKGPMLFGRPLVVPITDVKVAEEAMVILSRDGLWSHWE